ncbi:hypothetical protein [Epilithonimonas arachidiradicis]|uniref:DUF1049 domain-containing protein n=1 Tax=Epilithonimonas arachidiradicis TaxID=1617282 RepID=A0A420DDE8_9FLAO|nr:hypothetical protein [Epilithonimonas arachidiradicis]RKE89803.1 hypothetical protein BXY58_0382 [Epilithonimonas arachidiradicis]GGG45456.1 hypothetical protein GCM10007332_03630 [Epilithonimonas arachidiradicis]
MKSLIVIGIILFGLGALLFYLNDMAIDLRVVYGSLCGIGIGLIIGGLVGYVSKGNAVKQAQIRQEFKQLQKEKAELERQKAENNINNGSF